MPVQVLAPVLASVSSIQYQYKYEHQYQYYQSCIAWLASQDEDMDVKERMEELTLDQEDASERVAKAR